MASLTREKIRATLTRRYSPRLHMSLILAACGLTAMATSWSLLHLGVGSMLVRYPVAISLAYVTFLVGVYTWLRAMGYIDSGGRRGNFDGGDAIDITSSGSSGGGGGGGGSIGGVRAGGGTFDGGGASASFAENQATPMALVSESKASGGGGGGSKGSGFSLSDGGGVDGDGLILILLAIALVAIVFITSGYLIWCAPDVLTEAAFGAALAGTLTRAARKNQPSGWVSGVVKKTWWPFAVVMVAALAFAGFAHHKFPAATTFRHAVSMALAQ